MSSTSDTTDTFLFYGALLAFAGIFCAPQVGTIIPVLVALYFMLVATNSIARGENKARRLLQEKRNKQKKDDYDDWRT
jgi:uncharacterized membrane protein YbaN (DUF454 family)